MSSFKAFLTGALANSSVRVFLIAFGGILIPGALGWLNNLTQWAKSDGQAPLPDWHSLAYLGVAAIAAGFIALLNLLLVGINSGAKAVKANRAAKRGDRGAADLMELARVTLLILALVVLLLGIMLLWGVLRP